MCLGPDPMAKPCRQGLPLLVHSQFLGGNWGMPALSGVERCPLAGVLSLLASGLCSASLESPTPSCSSTQVAPTLLLLALRGKLAQMSL